MRIKGLTKQEKQVWAALRSGDRVVLGTGDARHGAGWGPERTVRADVIRAFLVGEQPASGDGVPAVRLDGARIAGSLDLSFATVDHPLSLRSCYFDAKVDLHGLRSREIDLTGSHLAGGLRASTAQIEGHLLLDHATIEESVRLIAAHIRGALFMNGAHLSGGKPPSAQPAFEADGVKVDADVLCRDGFRAVGEVRAPGAVIGDTLCLDGAHLVNENGPALQLARTKIGGDLLCREPFTTQGEIDLADAVIEGQLNLEGAHLRRSTGPAFTAPRLTVRGELRCCQGFVADGELRLLNGRLSGPFVLDGAKLTNPDGIAMHASGLTADGIYCRDGFHARGEIRLSGARITGPLDFFKARLTHSTNLSLGCWYLSARELILLFAAPVSGVIDLRYAHVGLLNYAPEASATEVRLDGLTYNAIAPIRDLETGLAWLNHAPAGFRPQPYEQLAETYRRNGHDALAREILLAKERRRRSTLSTPARIWGYVQDFMVGYGYRPWRAAGWLLLLLIGGSIASGVSHPIALDPDTAPPFSPFVYTLDLLIPIVDFGQKRAYFPAHAWQQWFTYGLTAGGWILATTIAAGITRSLRRQ